MVFNQKCVLLSKKIQSFCTGLLRFYNNNNNNNCVSLISYTSDTIWYKQYPSLQRYLTINHCLGSRKFIPHSTDRDIQMENIKTPDHALEDFMSVNY